MEIALITFIAVFYSIHDMLIMRKLDRMEKMQTKTLRKLTDVKMRLGKMKTRELKILRK